MTTALMTIRMMTVPMMIRMIAALMMIPMMTVPMTIRMTTARMMIPIIRILIVNTEERYEEND